ncbi:MAG TPA: hypothetical protein VMD77_03530, partial [Candidatus Baltobacteraceae bacterium]|nr:hypothetical protein [Candidatus Baltobacteraceae bacterium]
RTILPSRAQWPKQRRTEERGILQQVTMGLNRQIAITRLNAVCCPFTLRVIYTLGAVGSEEADHGKVRESGRQKRSKRDASQKTRNVAVREGRKRRQGEKPQASDRHRPFGGAEEGRKGSAEKIQLAVLHSDAEGNGRMPDAAARDNRKG